MGYLPDNKTDLEKTRKKNNEDCEMWLKDPEKTKWTLS